MKLVWDATGQRFYETGTRMGVLYPQDNAGTYSAGYAWNGLISVSENPSGAESNPLYADDIKYLDLRSKEEFGATLEAYTYPDEFMECDGSAELTDGVIVGQQSRKPFGLCYRTILGNDVKKEDYAYKLHLIYGCTATPSEKSYQTTNDSPEAITFSWEINTVPVNVTGHQPTATLVVDSSKFTGDKKAYLDALEDVLYGTSNTTARLPLPDEVLSILSGATVESE